MTAETLLARCDERGICLHLLFDGSVDRPTKVHICPSGETPSEKVLEAVQLAEVRLLPLLKDRLRCKGCEQSAPSPTVTETPQEIPEIHLIMRAARKAAQEGRMPDGGVCVPLPGDGRMSLSPRRYLLRVTEDALVMARRWGDTWPMEGASGKCLYADWKAIALWWQEYEKGAATE